MKNEAKKIHHFGEIAYICGIFILSFGVVLITKGGFGMSMVVAPAYLISIKCNTLTFGMAEYLWQAFLLILFCLIIRQFRWSYLLSFVTAVIYGFVLDFWIELLQEVQATTHLSHLLFYAAGILCSALGIAFFFRSYLSPQVYELFVKGIAKQYGLNLHKFKIIYDFSSMLLAIFMSFLFFGELKGLGIGTLICCTNGVFIGIFGKILDALIDFSPRLPLYKCKH